MDPEMAGQDLEAAAFPSLDNAQLESLGRCTKVSLSRFRKGQTLFQVGDRDFKFFAIKSGEVEIIDPGSDPPRTVVVHGPGHFTGDVAHLTGSISVVTAIARTDCEAYEVSAEALREVLNRFPELGDLILRAFIARRQLARESGAVTGVRLIGSRYSRDTFRIREFLSRNRVPSTWIDLEDDPQVDRLLRQFGVHRDETPVVTLPGISLRNPSNSELAQALGLRRRPDDSIYDLVIVGSGPAGLAAAVYGASEGLNTLILERSAPGGQVSGTMRVENYLGFPTGTSGGELMERAVLQAQRFGACLSMTMLVTELSFEDTRTVVRLASGEVVKARCLLIASGAQYRRLSVEGCDRFEGCGVYYAATLTEAQVCTGADVVVVGAGNSAGQAALFLAGRARKVYLLVRGDELHKSMSNYLVERILQTPNIEVLYDTTVRWMTGDKELREVRIVNSKTGEERTLPIRALFSFIGAVPHTDWLPKDIQRDAKDFVRTGTALTDTSRWTLSRQPFLLETSRPGVFAAGDVRSGSVKRVASAVGEGAMTVQFVHAHLQET
jgi:thioredoxin reductase (NADPH)